MNHDIWLALISVLGGGVGIKLFEAVAIPKTVKYDFQTKLRDELRKERNELQNEYRTIQRELDEWRDKYYALLEKYNEVIAKYNALIDTKLDEPQTKGK